MTERSYLVEDINGAASHVASLEEHVHRYQNLVKGYRHTEEDEDGNLVTDDEYDGPPVSKEQLVDELHTIARVWQGAEQQYEDMEEQWEAYGGAKKAAMERVSGDDKDNNDFRHQQHDDLSEEDLADRVKQVRERYQKAIKQLNTAEDTLHDVDETPPSTVGAERETFDEEYRDELEAIEDVMQKIAEGEISAEEASDELLKE